MNIQGLKDKVSILESFLSNQDIRVVCLSEHWLDANNVSLAAPNGFTCSSSYTRKEHIRGGTLILTHDSLQPRILDLNSFCLEFHFEVSAVFLDEFKYIVVSIYHSPSGDYNLFIEKLELLLVHLSVSGQPSQ